MPRMEQFRTSLARRRTRDCHNVVRRAVWNLMRIRNGSADAANVPESHFGTRATWESTQVKNDSGNISIACTGGPEEFGRRIGKRLRINVCSLWFGWFNNETQQFNELWEPPVAFKTSNPQRSAVIIGPFPCECIGRPRPLPDQSRLRVPDSECVCRDDEACSNSLRITK